MHHGRQRDQVMAARAFRAGARSIIGNVLYFDPAERTLGNERHDDIL
jgi:hypothetical protein